MEESSGGISDVNPSQSFKQSIPFKLSFSTDDNMYIYMLVAVLVICGVIYFMFNKTFTEFGNMFMSKKPELPKVNNNYYINDINGNKILVSGTLISEPDKPIIKPKITHPQKELDIADINFDDIQMEEDDKTKLHNLTNSEMNEIHQKLENIEY